jgi:hypothetical protein
MTGFERAVRAAIDQMRADMPPIQISTAAARSAATDKCVAAIVAAHKRAAALPYCPVCETNHVEPLIPCEPPGPCPDCFQTHCAPDCPGRREDPGDEPL